MFEAYTYEKILDDIMARAPDGIDLRQGSIFYDAISGYAFKIAKYYTDLDMVFELVFLATATGDYLTLRAEEHGVYRRAATPAKYYMTYTGTTPDVGTRFFASGQYFVLMNDDELGLYLEAEDAGTGANDIQPGTSVVPVDTISGLSACSIAEALESGAEEEDDASLRQRVQEKIAGPAENGNMQHYKTWCESIDGVGRARIIPLWNGLCTVKGVLIDMDGGAASAAVVKAVQDYIDPGGTGLGEGEANIGAYFTAVAATPITVKVSVYVTLSKGGDLATVKANIQDAIKSLIKTTNLENEESKYTTLRVSAVGNIIYDTTGVLDYTDLTLNGGTANIEVSKTEIFALGEVTVLETNAVS